MRKGRLEAFSDGVIAIIITILVLELKVPQGAEWAALRPLLPTFATYLISFVFLGIYWNNHHHMLQTAQQINGRILWANTHLLFWLSLFPFATGWMGSNSFAPNPTAFYGAIMLLAALAYLLLQYAIIAQQGENSPLRKAIGRDLKGSVSFGLYAAAIGLAYVHPWISVGIYVLVALIWLVPDRRIEMVLRSEPRDMSCG